MKRKKLFQTLLMLCIIGLQIATAQVNGWQKKISPDKMMGITTIYQNADGTFLTTGVNLTSEDTRIMKLDANGNILWKADHDSIYSFTLSVITQDGGYYILGVGKPDSANHQNRVVLKTDANGQKIWLKRVHAFQNKPGQGLLGNMAIDTTDDGGFICTMNPHNYNNIDTIHNLLIKRLDANGNILWERIYYDTTSFYSTTITNSKDGGFIVGLGGWGVGDRKFFKIDGAGNFLWEYELPGAVVTPQIARDGNILIVGSSNNFGAGISVIGKVDQNGNDLWLQQYPVLPDSASSYGAIEMGGDTIAVLCAYRDSQSPSGYEFGLAKFDTLGNVFAYYNINSANLGYNLRKLPTGNIAFVRTIDDGFVFGGLIDNGPNVHSAYIIKVDNQGRSYLNTISGNTFYDANVNCDKDANEILLAGKVLTLSSVSDTFRIMTNDSGYYALGVNPELYNIEIENISPYWEQTTCNVTQVQILPDNDTIISFGFDAAAQLPYISINGNTRQRICDNAIYTVKYCNNGTVPFYGVVEVTFDDLLQIDSASIPWATQLGNKLIFLEDTGLQISECRTIEVYYTVPCDLDLTGRTTCINTHAYSDSVTAISPLWDQSNLRMMVSYNTVTDSVEFVLKNVGNGNMSAPKDMIVIEDNVILMKEAIQLAPGFEHIHKLKANGSTWRATVFQTEFNPYSLFATAAREAAGATVPGTFSTGFINQFPINGYYGFDHNVCTEILNSFDPNRKSVFPKGVGSMSLVDKNIDLEYLLEFQNTGTDTAYVVRLVDTLATYLNPATLKPGVSSHPYEFRFLSHNVIEFLFEAINLPDSTTDERGSNGFVRFNIKQQPDNADGTEINNNVAIYFDYNLPVITNTATVRIGEVQFVGIENLYAEKEVKISAYPNPFRDDATIKVEGENFKEMQLTIYDVSGKIVKQQKAFNTNQFTINRSGFNNGIYLFEINNKGKIIGRGKIIAH